jgi:predicted small metal-binding protein
MSVNLSCGDVIPGCAAVFEADSESELLGLISAHAAADHDLTDIDDDTLTAVKSAITTS